MARQGDLARVRDIAHELSVWSDSTPPMGAVLAPMLELFGAETAASYGIDEADGGFRLRFVHAAGTVDAGYRRTFERVLGGAKRAGDRRFGFFDPDRPEPWQRNKILDFAELQARGLRSIPAMGRAAATMGIAIEDQLRVLVCDGPHLLALVAMYRPGVWGTRERRLLSHIVPAMRRRLLLERSLGAARLLEAAFDAAMEGIPAAAFVLDRYGAIVHANAAGLVVLEARASDVRAELRAAALGRARASRFRVTRVAAAGTATHFLAIARGSISTRGLAAAASERWSLTPRQALVLAHLVDGATNARIGAELGISERTVEVHVAAIMGRAECHTRAMLISAVLRQQ